MSQLPRIEIALYQPDIAQNVGTLLRLGACLGVPVRIIEPAGFPWDDAGLRRSGMDYLKDAEIRREVSFAHFRQNTAGRRLVLASTRAAVAHTDFAFAPGDILLFGRESAGVPEAVHAAADARIVIPLKPGFRSLNVAVAAAMVTGEALRQLGGFPRMDGLS